MTTQFATLTLNNQSIALPILQGTMGGYQLDIQSLDQHHLYTFDPGFTSTSACASSISYINGEIGQLLHQGYPIEELAQKTSFLDVFYLLLNEKLPNEKEQKQFEQAIQHYNQMDSDCIKTLQTIDSTMHPMGILSVLIAVLAGKYHEHDAFHNKHERINRINHMIAQMPILVAMIYRHQHHLPLVSPQKDLSFIDNFLYMMFHGTEHPFTDQIIINAIDRILLLHADHEQNASTSTARLIGSTGSNIYSVFLGGISALWGPAHGGANEAVLNMLSEIGDEKNIDHYLKRAQDKTDSFRLMGFGHRIYKKYDPRATLMKETCHDVLNKSNLTEDPTFKLAKKLETLALKDDYFISRHLYPNVDFYSGIILKAIGIPNNMLTVIFALGRTAGWLAQWQELVSQPNRISRPRQLYVGSELRHIT
ncbi:MAG: citrate synthase [Endozoicomonadaceae bacterium]|nr:citrate synthase [Endozoicomonadaceae bacterium]